MFWSEIETRWRLQIVIVSWQMSVHDVVTDVLEYLANNSLHRFVEEIRSGQNSHHNYNPADVDCSIPSSGSPSSNSAGDHSSVSKVPPLKGIQNHGSQETQHTHPSTSRGQCCGPQLYLDKTLDFLDNSKQRHKREWSRRLTKQDLS